MWLPSFRLHRPKDLDEALRIKADLGTEVRPLAGGTDLLPNYKWHIENKADVLALSGLQELSTLNHQNIGACMTLSAIERDTDLAARLPVIRDTIRKIASPLLRNSATIGGKLMLDTRCHWVNQTEFWRHSQDFCMKTDESPICRVVPGLTRCVATYSGDLAPVLMVLGAKLRLAGTRGARDSKLADFFNEDGIDRHRLAADELLTGVLLPADASDYKAAYEKLRLRSSIDFPSAGLALALQSKDGVLIGIRAAHTAIASAPIDLSEQCAELIGAPLSMHTAQRLEAIVDANAKPYRNVPLPPSYRRTWLRISARRLFARLAGLDEAKAA